MVKNSSLNRDTLSLFSSSYKNKRAWIMVTCAGLFYFYQFLLRVLPSVLTEQLKITYDVNSCELGLLSACYYNAYVLMQIPIGIILDRLSVRHVISISCLLATLGTFIFTYALNLPLAGFGRFLMGMGAATGFIGTLKVASLCLPAKDIGRAVGLALVLGTCGATFGSAPIRFFADIFYWKHVLFFVGLCGIILAIIIFKSLKDVPILTNKSHQTINIDSILSQLQKIISSSQVWLLGVFGMLLYVPLAAFADLWGPSFLAFKLNISTTYAASLTLVIYIGVGIGAPLVAWISEKCHSYKTPMLWGAFISIICYSTIIYFDNINISIIITLLLIGGISFGGQCLIFPALATKVPTNLFSFATSFVNMIVMSSGVIFEPLIGKLLDIENMIATLESYKIALLPIVIALGLSIIVWGFIKVKFPSNKY